ncbi:hypothetical protein CS062_22790, partial [Roseateles chitinivorans]
MMIWLQGGAGADRLGGLGAEDGILRAAELDGAAELDALRRAMAEQRDVVLAQARGQALAL